jgi:hypothetical protein
VRSDPTPARMHLKDSLDPSWKVQGTLFHFPHLGFVVGEHYSTDLGGLAILRLESRSFSAACRNCGSSTTLEPIPA